MLHEFKQHDDLLFCIHRLRDSIRLSICLTEGFKLFQSVNTQFLKQFKIADTFTMTLQNENFSIEDGHLHENIVNLNSSGINNALSFLTNKSRRYRRDDYNEDDYEIVCKHSNTGRLANA